MIISNIFKKLKARFYYWLFTYLLKRAPVVPEGCNYMLKVMKRTMLTQVVFNNGSTDRTILHRRMNGIDIVFIEKIASCTFYLEYFVYHIVLSPSALASPEWISFSTTNQTYQSNYN